MQNVLVCDDEKDIVNALEIYLSSEDINVFKAYNGKEALDIIKENEIHLVLLDIMMPVMDGICTLNEIRKISNLPVIFLSAKSEDTDKILGLNIGADDYITKPFNLVEVIARVAAAYAIANLISDDELNADYIIPNPFDKRVAQAVAKAVSEAAIKTGVARIEK